MTRTAYIVKRVMEKLGDPDNRNNTRARALQVLDGVQREVCRRGLALKYETELTLTADVETYEVGGDLYKIAELMEPTEWQHEVTVLDSTAQWKHARRRTDLSTVQPLFAYCWDRKMHLWPVPQTTGQTLGMLAYMLPQETLTLESEPEVSDAWDDVMELGVIARITGDSDKQYEYMNEIDRVSAKERKETVAGVTRIEHSSNVLGF